MTSEILNTKVPSQTLPSPSSSEHPNIGSLPVTGVLSGANLQGPEKISADVMQDWQRQQTQPVIVPTLSSSRVTTSVADDLDALLDDTLEEFSMSIKSSSSSVQSIATSSVASIYIDEAYNMEELLAGMSCLGFAEFASSITEVSAYRMTEIGEELNHAIEMINWCFKSLLEHSNDPGSWLAQESKTPFYRNCHPFAASCYLMAHLDQVASNQIPLNQALIAEWKNNYQQCVILLKKYDLEQYNETEFPFSVQVKAMIFLFEMASKQLQNPQFAETVRQQWSSFAENPDGMMNQLLTENPQLADMMGAQTGDFRTDPAAIEKMIGPQIQQAISFFQGLDQVLQDNSEDAATVEAWLIAEADESTYMHPFYFSQSLLTQLSVKGLSEKDSPTSMLKSLSKSCCERLIKLGLQKYVDEAPPIQITETIKQIAGSQKEHVQLFLSKSLSCLRPLSEELKKLNLIPEECTANSQVIEQWIINCKTTGSYFPPFGTGLDQHRQAFEEVLDKDLFNEFNVLLPFCRDRLLELGLNIYVEEKPPILGSTAKTPVITSPVFKNAILDTERLTREIKFFKVMIHEKDEAVDLWLKENSPKFDYPLLWAKKRFFLLSHFRDADIELRREWRMCADVCLERVDNTVHVDLGQIPADASPELKAFLS